MSGALGRLPPVPTDPVRLERAAKRAMSEEAFAYVAGGAGMESTIAAGREAFERWKIVPRMLRDVSHGDTSAELFGRRLPAPLLTAPVGVLGLAHRDADLGVARAAAAEGIPMIFSSQASVPMETCAEAMGSSPRWFQLYWSTSDDVVVSFVERAERCGCQAIVVTLDIVLLGWRSRDIDLAYLPFVRALGIAQYTSDPAFQALVERAEPPPRPRGRPTLEGLRTLWTVARNYPGSTLANLRSSRPRTAVRTFVDTFQRPALEWDNLPFLRERTKLPILLKGILHPDDARRALDYGIDGIVVSTHGGRQVDGSIASLDALPSIVEAVDGRVPVLLDSGIRGGADVFKALALGARAVLVGRPYVYGLGIAGELGVRTVLQNLVADFDLTMRLAGCAAVSEITRDALTRIP